MDEKNVEEEKDDVAEKEEEEETKQINSIGRDERGRNRK